MVLAGRRAGQRWVDAHREVGEGCTEREGERWRQRRDGETVMGVGREITERDEGTVRARDRNPTPKTAPGKHRPGSTRQTQAEKNIQGHSEREQTHGVRAQSRRHNMGPKKQGGVDPDPEGQALQTEKP